jgi:hypothetical protein
MYVDTPTTQPYTAFLCNTMQAFFCCPSALMFILYPRLSRRGPSFGQYSKLITIHDDSAAQAPARFLYTLTVPKSLSEWSSAEVRARTCA